MVVHFARWWYGLVTKRNAELDCGPAIRLEHLFNPCSENDRKLPHGTKYKSTDRWFSVLKELRIFASFGVSKKTFSSRTVRLVAVIPGFRHPGTYPKNPGGFFGYTHLKNPPPKNPHFYFSLILVCTLYATNNAIFYCFKAFKALSYWVFVLFYLCFPACPKKPNKTQKPNKTKKNPVGWAFF